MDDEGKNLLIFFHGVIGQGQLCPPARGCHALRCLVFIFSMNTARKNLKLSQNFKLILS